jgi:hypothetical protein
MPACENAADANPFHGCTKVLPRAYSTLAVSNVETGTLLLAGLGSTKIQQVFATGRAAQVPNAPSSVAQTFAALENLSLPGVKLIPHDSLVIVQKLQSGLDDADATEQPLLISAVNRHLGTSAETKAQAKARLAEAATKVELRTKLESLYAEVAALLDQIEKRRAGPGSSGGQG